MSNTNDAGRGRGDDEIGPGRIALKGTEWSDHWTRDPPTSANPWVGRIPVNGVTSDFLVSRLLHGAYLFGARLATRWRRVS